LRNAKSVEERSKVVAGVTGLEPAASGVTGIRQTADLRKFSDDSAALKTQGFPRTPGKSWKADGRLS